MVFDRPQLRPVLQPGWGVRRYSEIPQAVTTDPFDRAQALYFDLRRRDLAIREIERALSAEPNDPRTHALLALCRSDGKNSDAALQAARTAIRLGPDQAWCHYVMGWVLWVKGNFHAAEDEAREAVRLDPVQPGFWELLALTLLDTG